MCPVCILLQRAAWQSKPAPSAVSQEELVSVASGEEDSLLSMAKVNSFDTKNVIITLLLLIYFKLTIVN